MKKPPQKSDAFADLRKKARKKLGEQLERLKALSAKDVHELVQELGTHQIELEMQNDELRRSQAELEASRSKYSDLYDFAPVGYCTLDRSGQIREINLTAAALLGTERRSLMNKRFSTYVEKASQDAFHLHCAAVLASREKQVVEIRLKGRGKAGFYALLESVAVEDHAGDAVAIRTTISDITELKNAGEALKKANETLELRVAERTADQLGILNATQESILLFSAGGVLRMANQIALQRFGRSAEEAIGKHVKDLIPPDLAKTRLVHLNDVVRTGQPVEFEDKRGDTLFRHTVSPVFDSRGNVTDAAIFSRDITRQRENEERLAYLASFPQLNPNPVLEADLAGAVTFANPATYRTLEHLGLDFTDKKAFLPSDLSNVLAAWDKKNPATVDGEVMIADRVFNTSAYLEPGLGVARIYAYDITERKRAEEALRRSEVQFRTLADSIPNLAWWANGNGYITWYNRRWYEYTGTTPEQMEGWGWQSVHDPKVLPEVLERWKASISTGEPFEMEFPLRGADGVFRTFLTRVLPLKDPAGRALRWFGTNTDVSALKLAEDALRESERRERERAEELATMLDAVPTPVIIVHDPDSLHMTGNRAADELLRQPRGSEASLSAPSEVKPRHFRPFKDGHELSLDELPAQRAARGEQVRDFEFSLVFDDDTTRSLLGYGTPLLDEQGRPRGAIHVLVDITARKMAEEALRERERKYRTLIDRMIDGFALHEIVVDASGLPQDYRFLEVNAAFERLTGLRGADIIGKRVTQVLPGVRESDFDWIGAYGKVALTGEELRTEQYSDELGKWYSITAYSPQKGFFATIFEDITERKRVEQELLRNQVDLDRAQEVGSLGSWRIDVQRNVISWSNETYRIFGVPRGTPMNYDLFLSAVHPDDRARVHDRWQKAMYGEPYDLEHRIVADGRVKWIREKAYLELGPDGSLTGGFGIAQDITERKKIEEALQKARDELEMRVQERTRELQIANDSVKTERQRLYSVLETLPVYVILLDKEHRIPFSNRFFRQRFGEPGGRRCYEYLFNRTEACENCETYTVQKTNAPHHWYWTGPDKRDYDIYDFPFVDSDGSALILEMGIDITNQKKAQQALRATITEITLAERRAMLINDLLSMFTRETDRAAFLDAAIELIRRWSGCRHVGVRVVDEREHIPYVSCVGFSDEFLDSERRLSLEQDHCACTRVVRGAPEPQDLSAMTPAGSFYTNNFVRFVEGLTEEQRSRFRGACLHSGFLSLSVVPIRYRDKVLGAMHVADEQEGMVPYATVEFLEQVALIIGEALFRFGVERESSRLAAAVESAADAVVVTESEQGTILYVNDSFEKMTGYSRSEAVGKDIHLLDSGRHDAAFYDALRSALRRDGAWRGQLVNMKKDGTLYFEDCTISPVRDHSGQILNYVSVRRDITEKIRLESIAESVSMMDNMGAIFAGVRHEIGNPINNAKIHLSVLQQKMNTMPADRVREYVDRTLAEIGRVEHLLHTLKTFNLFETPVLEDLETGPLLELFRGLVREDLEVKGITLSTQILPGAESVRANARALQHVLLNLVTNAADALKDRPGPRIDIMFSREDDRVRIRISDNGAGMNASQLANLFKPFHTTKQHGTGLGLVIVKKMLTTIKGTIEIASHEGSGTAVAIYLPGGTHAGTA